MPAACRTGAAPSPAGPVPAPGRRGTGRTARILLRGLALIALGLPAAAPAQAEKPLALYAHDHWSRTAGLPDDAVNAIAESGNGFVWFGTDDGLVRFDGDRIGAVPPLRGGPFNESVSAIHVDTDDAVWVGTVHAGLWRLQINEPPQQWTQAHGLPSNAVLAVSAAPDGTLYVGTRHGAVRYRGGRIEPLQAGPAGPIDGIAAGDDGVWLARRDGALLHVDRDGHGHIVDLPGRATGPLVVDAAGRLWVATSLGLYVRDVDGHGRMLGPDDGLASTLVRALYVDRAGAVWIGFDGAGVQRLDRGRFDRFGREQGLAHPHVRVVFEDRHGAIWLGTGAGVERLHDAAVSTFRRDHGLGSDFVRSVAIAADGGVWAGSDSGGLARIDGARVRRYDAGDGLVGDTVRAVATAADGSVWVAVHGAGLQRLHADHWQTWTAADGLPSTLITVLMIDVDGSLWLGSSDRGAFRFADGRFDVFDSGRGMPSNHVRAIVRRGNGDLLFGTADRGIARLRDGRVERLFDRDTGMPCDRINTLYEDDAGRLWVGTHDGLVGIVGDRVIDLSPLDPVLAHEVRFVGSDRRGGLWIAGSRGTMHAARIEQTLVPPSVHAAGALRRLERSDGLPSSAINGGTQPTAAVGADGRLWLPTPRGLAVVDPQRLTPQHPLPFVQIESLHADGAPLSLGRPHHRLEAGARRIEIGFGGVHSLGVDRPLYQWRLDGLQHDWSRPSPDRDVEYAALPPGRYEFRVRAITDHSRRMSNEARIGFTIPPLLYQQTWFAGALILVIGLLAVAAARVRHRRLLSERSRLIAEVDRRTLALRDALLHAEHLARAKSVFLANMSHELRTPLSAIIGYTELARHEGTGASADAVERIDRNAHLLLDLVNDVLDASRIDAGQLGIELEAVPPLAAAEDAVQLLAGRARGKGLALRLERRGRLPATVRADPLRLRQVLLNLVGNAIKFSDHGMIVVRVHADAQARTCIFDVEDQGIGIAPAQIERLFRPFEQLDAATTRRHGGSGLGLYITRELITRMGGTISVASQPGRGSRFRVELPATTDADWNDAPQAPATPEAERVPTPALRGTVLLAEDGEDMRELLRAIISGTGADVVAVADGQAALEAASARRFDLVLMDMHMPRLDGRAATRALRERGYRGAIVALTADITADAMLAHQRAGCDGILAKPVQRQRLFDVLRLHLTAAGGDADDHTLAQTKARLRMRLLGRLAAESEQLASAARAGDRDAVCARLHRLKGSCSMFDLAEEADLAARAEAAFARDDAGAAAALQALIAALQRAAQAAAPTRPTADLRVADREPPPR